MNTSFVFLANGFEEVEALTTIDIMRRAGMEVLNAVNRIEIGRGIIAGSAVVIVAIIMDRITQGIAHRSEEKRHGK